MMMFPMLTEETPTYICFSGLGCDEAGMGKISRAAPITIADIVLPKELRRVMITSNQTVSQHLFSYGSVVIIKHGASYSIAPSNVKPDLFAGGSKRLRAEA